MDLVRFPVLGMQKVLHQLLHHQTFLHRTKVYHQRYHRLQVAKVHGLVVSHAASKTSCMRHMAPIIKQWQKLTTQCLRMQKIRALLRIVNPSVVAICLLTKRLRALLMDSNQLKSRVCWMSCMARVIAQRKKLTKKCLPAVQTEGQTNQTRRMHSKSMKKAPRNTQQITTLVSCFVGSV